MTNHIMDLDEFLHMVARNAKDREDAMQMLRKRAGLTLTAWGEIENQAIEWTKMVKEIRNQSRNMANSHQIGAERTNDNAPIPSYTQGSKIDSSAFKSVSENAMSQMKNMLRRAA